MSQLIAVVLFLVISPVAYPQPAQKEEGKPENQASLWQPFQGLLEKYVSRTSRQGITLNVLDYDGIRKDPLFALMIDRLKSFSPDKLKTEQEKLAFWINAYNFLAIKLVAEHYPVKSIRDIGSFFRPVWRQPAGTIGARVYSLNEIEHTILRKQLDEPRVHLAIVCASLSCPDIRKEIYRDDKLEEQLDDQTRAFMANPTKGLKIENKIQRAYLSMIFNWFATDFEQNGSLWNFIRRYRPDLNQKNEYTLEYLPYNWSLNDL